MPRVDGSRGLAMNAPVSLGTSVGVGLLLFCATIIYVEPRLWPVYHGVIYCDMSLNPWRISADNPLQYRILSPLLGYLLGLRGKLFVYLPILAAMGWLVLIHARYARLGFSSAESTGMAALIAFSSPTFYTLYFAGYTDSIGHLLIYLALLARSPSYRAWLFGLALLNHEAVVCYLPMLLFRPDEPCPTMRGLIGNGGRLLIGAMPAMLWRVAVATQVDVAYGASHYLAASNIVDNIRLIFTMAPLGLFQAFKLFWYLPLAAGMVLWRERQFTALAWLVLGVGGVLAQLLVANDTSRLAGFAFPAVLFGAEVIRRHLGGDRFIHLLRRLVVLNLLVPSYYVGQSAATLLPSVPVSLLAKGLGLTP